MAQVWKYELFIQTMKLKIFKHVLCNECVYTILLLSNVADRHVWEADDSNKWEKLKTKSKHFRWDNFFYNGI